MPRKYLYYFLIPIFILASSFPVFGSAAGVCSDFGYSVFTINGIWTNEQGAKVNLDALQDVLDPLWNNEPVYLDYLHNPSHIGGAEDVVKSVAQAIIDSQNISDTDLKSMLLDASQKLKTQKLLLVAHSQGNFYANSFYGATAGKDSGIPKESIAVYGVASPSSFVSGGGKYITSDTDKVINLVRELNPSVAALQAGVSSAFTADFAKKLLSKVLPANSSIELKPQDDENSHKFAEVYLKYQAPRIVKEIQESLAQLRISPDRSEDAPCLLAQELNAWDRTKDVLFAVLDPGSNVAVGAAKSSVQAVASLVNNIFKFGGAQVGQTLETLPRSNLVAQSGEGEGELTEDEPLQDSTQELAPQTTLSDLQKQLNEIASQVNLLSQKLADLGAAQAGQTLQFQNAGSSGTPFTTAAPQTSVSQEQETESESGEQEQEGQAVQEEEQEDGEEDEAEEQEAQQASIVVINEMAWMGTATSTSDEWIELHNTTKNEIDLTGWKLLSSDGSPNIALTKPISALGFYLLERTDDNTVSDIAADQTYTGALNNNPNCEVLTLYDQNNNAVDRTACLENGNWPAGDNSTKQTMERINPRASGDDSSSWANNNTLIKNGLDANGDPIKGTPRAQNSVYQTLAPDPVEDFTLDSQASYSNKARLTWAISTDPDTVSENLSYKIYYSKEGEITENNLNGENIKAATTTQTAITISELDYNSTYHFGIKAFDPGNNFSDLATTTFYKTATLGVVASGFPSNLSIDNNGRELVRTSNGDLYAAYHRDNKVFLAKSEDNGLNWNELAVTPNEESEQINPSIALDSQNNLHIVWQGETAGTSTVYQIRYVKYDGNSFLEPKTFTANKEEDQEIPMIAVDSQNNIHLAWVGKNNPGDALYYVVGSGGDWGNTDIVKNKEFSGGLWSLIEHFSFVVDKDDVLRFVWFESVPSGGCCTHTYLRYRKGNFGAWGGVENLTEVDLQNYASAALDSQSNLHIVWHEPRNRGHQGWFSLVQYLKCSDECDSNDIETLNEEKNVSASLSVAVDSGDNIYIVWKINHPIQPRPLSKTEYRNGAWQEGKELISPFEWQSFSNMLYQANQPQSGYAFVFYEGEELKFYGSEDLSWE